MSLVCQSSTVNLSLSNDLDSSCSRCLQLPGTLEKQGNLTQQEFDKHRASKTLFSSAEWAKRNTVKLQIIEHIL